MVFHEHISLYHVLFQNNDIENIEQHKINSNKVITIPQNDAILNLAYEFGISNYYNIDCYVKIKWKDCCNYWWW